MKLTRLTTTGKASDAAISPDGRWGVSWTPDGKILYGSNAGGNRDVWLLDPGRGTRKQLTADAQQNFYPVVTADGRYIVFLSDRGEGFGLWRMDADGGTPKRLLPLTNLGIIGSAACSPDGRWVVFAAVASKGVPGLWKVSVDGGEPVLLNDEYWEEVPTYSPDGKQVAFQYFSPGAADASLSLG